MERSNELPWLRMFTPQEKYQTSSPADSALLRGGRALSKKVHRLVNFKGYDLVRSASKASPPVIPSSGLLEAFVNMPSAAQCGVTAPSRELFKDTKVKDFGTERTSEVQTPCVVVSEMKDIADASIPFAQNKINQCMNMPENHEQDDTDSREMLKNDMATSHHSTTSSIDDTGYGSQVSECSLNSEDETIYGEEGSPVDEQINDCFISSTSSSHKASQFSLDFLPHLQTECRMSAMHVHYEQKPVVSALKDLQTAAAKTKADTFSCSDSSITSDCSNANINCPCPQSSFNSKTTKEHDKFNGNHNRVNQNMQFTSVAKQLKFDTLVEDNHGTDIVEKGQQNSTDAFAVTVLNPATIYHTTDVPAKPSKQLGILRYTSSLVSDRMDHHTQKKVEDFEKTIQALEQLVYMQQKTIEHLKVNMQQQTEQQLTCNVALMKCKQTCQSQHATVRAILADTCQAMQNQQQIMHDANMSIQMQRGAHIQNTVVMMLAFHFVQSETVVKLTEKLVYRFPQHRKWLPRAVKICIIIAIVSVVQTSSFQIFNSIQGLFSKLAGTLLKPLGLWKLPYFGDGKLWPEQNVQRKLKDNENS